MTYVLLFVSLFIVLFAHDALSLPSLALCNSHLGFVEGRICVIAGLLKYPVPMLLHRGRKHLWVNAENKVQLGHTYARTQLLR